MSVTTRLMPSAPKNPSSKTARKLSSEPPNGRNVGVNDWSVDLGEERRVDHPVDREGPGEGDEDRRATVDGACALGEPREDRRRAGVRVAWTSGLRPP